MMADAIRKLSGIDRQFFACEMVTNGLMNLRAEAPDAEIAIEAAKTMGFFSEVVKLLFTNSAEETDRMIDATIDHMLNGKDETDSTSAGGWNAQELEQAYASLFVARRGLSVPFGGNVQ